MKTTSTLAMTLAVMMMGSGLALAEMHDKGHSTKDTSTKTHDTNDAKAATTDVKKDVVKTDKTAVKHDAMKSTKKHKKWKHGKVKVMIPQDMLDKANVMIGSTAKMPVAMKLAKKIVKIEHPELWEVKLMTHTGVKPGADDIMIGSSVGSKAGEHLRAMKAMH